MRSKILLAGVVGAFGLTVLAVVAAAQSLWWLVTACVMALLSAIFAVVLDANRKTRYLRTQLRAEASRIRQESGVTRAEPVDPIPPTITEFDVVGAVQVLQAQYVGRMDRMQQTLDRAVEVIEQTTQSDHTPR